MNKLIVNKQVAVLYSPNTGAGWYTWNDHTYPEILFDPAIVKLVLEGRFDELATYVELKYPDIYTGGMRNLQVGWVNQGSKFRVVEYDGSESIEIEDDIDWLIA